MEYQVTARKWRPQTFAEVIGQEHVTRALRNAIASKKIPHAYLFSGPRGVGKTTTARLLAKALNCENGPTPEPCNNCACCVDIMNGNSLDVQEVDGASNRGIEEIRRIRDNVAFLPMASRHKIYIIDEVHMLTKEASNALLKTLEEPPNHIIFILATTEPHNVIPTIRSRTQHYVFKRISSLAIIEQLKKICQNDGISADDDALFVIASEADGSMRDAQSIFDQIALYTDGNIREADALEVLGIPDEVYFHDIINAVKAQGVIDALSILNRYLEKIGEVKLFVKGFINFLRNGLIAKKLGIEHELIDLTESRYQQIKSLFADFSEQEIIRIINLFSDLFRQLRGDASERFLIESAVFKMMDYKNMVPLSEIRDELLKIVQSGGGVAPAVSRPQPSQSTPPPAGDTQYKHLKLEKPVTEHKEEEESESKVPVAGAEEAFLKIISKSGMLNAMREHIRSTRMRGNTLDVLVSTPHAYEWFSNQRDGLSKKLSNVMGGDFSVNFIQDKNKSGSHPAPEVGEDTGLEDSAFEVKESPDVKDEVIPAEAKKDKPQDNGSKDSGNDVGDISADLFDGSRN
jgi:DNA polymerase-3 subunit gamma/tau